MREEYEKKARQKREQDLENLVRSRGEFQLTLDATQVFDPYEPPVFVGFGQQIQPTKKKNAIVHALSKAQTQQLFMRHSFEVITSLFFYSIATDTILNHIDANWTSNTCSYRWIYGFQIWYGWW